MFTKIALVVVIVAGIVASIVFITAAMPAIQSMVDIATTDPSAANYTYYEDAVVAAPLWLYFIPVIVGGIAVIIVLRKPEGRRY